PGEGIFAANSNDGYRTYGGTSYATPHLSGAVGLLYSLAEVPFCDIAKLSPSDAARSVKRFILDGVTSLPTLTDRTVSGGRLDLSKTFDLITSTSSPNPAHFSIYPNPTRSQAILDFTEVNDFPRITVTDIFGKVIWSTRDHKGLSQIAIPSEKWIAGTYLVRVFAGNKMGTQLLIKHEK
ncbi:MAG: S8 family peptidase, partial [Saprospiraceae bacterium]|nr:S8 family peptidase [Saprospiraceae bacterium]